MADTGTSAPRKRKWLKWLGIVVGAFLLLLITLYFVVTSSGFIKSAVLPKVSKSIGAEVTASDISLSPFKQIVIRDLKVQAPGKEPLVVIPEVRVQYRLMDILKGNYNIDLISVSAPTITMVERADGSSNLDPLLQTAAEEEQPEEPQKDEPMNLDLRKLVVENGTVRYEKQPSASGSYSSEITKLNFNLEGLKTGGTGKMTLSALFAMRSQAPAPGTNGSMAGTINGAFDLGLTPLLKPSVIKGNTKLEIKQADAGYAMANGMSMVFDADVTPSEVRQLALRLLQGGNELGELVASGPFSMEKVEGSLDVRLGKVGSQALALASADSGMDFGKTAISSTNRINIGKGGQELSAAGAFFVNDLQITVTNQRSPLLTFQAAYDVSVDAAASNAVVRTLTMSGTQNGRQFLKGAMTAPMVVNWGKADQAVGDSAFTMTLDQFNLGEWKALTGDSLQGGVLNSKVEVLSKGAGRLITFSHKTLLDNLSLVAGSNTISGVSMALSGEGAAKELEQFESKYTFELSHSGARGVEVSGSGIFNKTTQEAKGGMKGTARIPELMGIVAMPDTKFSAGQAQFDLQFQQERDAKAQTIQGDFHLANLTGVMGSNTFQNFEAVSKLDVRMTEQTAEIRKATVNLAQGGKPGGVASISGVCDLSNSATKVKLELKDLNENVLRSFLQSALGDKALASITINGHSSVDYKPAGASSITADFKMANLVVKDPTGTVPPSPLEAGLALDVSMNGAITEIKQGLLTLTPTKRAKNQVSLGGRLDASDTNFTSGKIEIRADSLDLTTYFQLLQATGEAPEQAQAQAPAKPSGPRPPGAPQPQVPGAPQVETEPEATVLPLSNFVVNASVGRLYIVELDMTNLVANTRIDGGRVEINPFQVAINGSPMRSIVNLDMSVPGYKYDVFFGMTNVPFAPLVNTFVPERKGQVGGTISANTQIKGMGTTGVALQKNLAGNFDLATTNLNLSISELRSPMLKTIINVVAIVPSIIKNPNAGLGSLAGALLGSSAAPAEGAKAGGDWSDELLKSPIDVIEANAKMGGGNVNLTRAFVQSPAFQAQAKGTIKLAKVLTNSPVEIPLSIAVRRGLAESINLVPPGTPTNAAYVSLPDYVSVKGTVGEPKPQYNTKALLGTALQQYGGNIPGVDQKTGNIIQGLGGILTGRKATNAPAPSGVTNAPSSATNQPSAPTNTTSSVLQGLGNILGGGTSSTNATGTTNAPATNNPVGNVIQGIFGPRKK